MLLKKKIDSDWGKYFVSFLTNEITLRGQQSIGNTFRKGFPSKLRVIFLGCFVQLQAAKLVSK